MTVKSSIKVFIFTALPCEAKPLVNRFKLKKQAEIQAFAVYSNDEICLSVTGLGKTAMAAGVAFSQAVINHVEKPIMLNVGVAGHKDHEIGDVFAVEKITDSDNGRHYYPPLVANLPCKTESIITSSVPQLEYRQNGLYDMEAAAFYEIASRFTTCELVQCIKVISDNQQSPADDLTPKQVTELIQNQLGVIEQLINCYKELAGTLIDMDLPLFEEFRQNYHFTVTEQNQLKALLARWAVLSDQQGLSFDNQTFNKGREVLIWLEQQINQLEFVL